jgi:predicted transposase
MESEYDEHLENQQEIIIKIIRRYEKCVKERIKVGKDIQDENVAKNISVMEIKRLREEMLQMGLVN